MMRTQLRLVVKIIATVLIVSGVAGSLAPVLQVSHRLHSDRTAIEEALTGTNQRLVGEQLQESGFITVKDRKIGHERLKGFQVLDENGVVTDPTSVTWYLISTEIPPWLPNWMLRSLGTTWIIAIIALAWGVSSVWLGLLTPLLYATIGSTFSWFLFRMFGMPGLSLAVAAIGLLAFTCALLLRILELLFGSPKQIPTIAKGLLLEASRTRLSLAFIALLLILLPLIPYWLDPASPLRHQLQTMLSRSLGITFAISACLTVLLSCATVAFEIRDRQVWQVMTKPVNKLGYLLGKWLGIVSLNATILCIAGLSIFIYIQYLRAQPVASGMQGELDRLAVEEEVLTARRTAEPVYLELDSQQLSARVDAIVEADSDLRDMEQIQIPLRRKIRSEVQEQYLASQRSIPPAHQGSYYQQTYTFTDLQEAKKVGAPIAFQYRFHILDSNEHEVHEAGFVFNQDPATRQNIKFVPTMTHVTLIPSSFVNDEGVLTVSIYNFYQPPPGKEGRGSISFDADGIKMLYRVGDFEPNFLRAIIVLWIKLAFLAAIGLSVATFLSFSVATLVTFTVFASGLMAPWLAESLQMYLPPVTSDVDFRDLGMVIQWGFENTIRGIASFLVFMLRGFGDQQPTSQLVQGLYISWGSVIQGFVTIGILWSGFAITIGTFVLRKRQLAIYSGSG
ncbi:MAG: hypothetical protein H8E91_02625 [Planctomycetes bacterium]|nr:hypothetical protein [Planctomycetota bacterium]